MARLNVVDPATAEGKAADIQNGPLKAKQLNIFKGIANNPGVLEAFLGWAGGVKAGSLDAKEHEVIALATGKVNGCDYCQAAHSKVAAGLGLDSDTIGGVKNFSVGDAKHQALIDFTRAVIDTQGHVSDEQLNAVKGAGYDDAAVVEIVGSIAVNTFTNYFNHVNDTEIDGIFK